MSTKLREILLALQAGALQPEAAEAELRSTQGLVKPLQAAVPMPVPETHQSRTYLPSGGHLTDNVNRFLAGTLAEVLYLSPSELDIDKPFVDMGLDSVLGVEWMRAINERYHVALAATKLYEFPTIRELASHVLHITAADALNAPDTTEVPSGNTPVAVDPAVSSLPASPLLPSEPPTSFSAHPLPVAAVQSLAFEEENSFLDAPLRMTKSEFATDHREKVAIIGMSGRYPGAADLEEYWDNLVHSRNSVREVPSTRWDVNRAYDPRPGQLGKIYCKWLGALEDIDCFDPLFFGISPAEAESMDPQHRLFLQEAYKAFEDAGYSPALLSNARCGVYLGIMGNEYSMILRRDSESMGAVTGNSAAIAAARIAYYLNLKGPVISIDTACSSSLVAAHLACQALLNREIDMAVVGGVTLYLSEEGYVGMCAAGMLSPSGQCSAFDNGADGFVPGEGVGALVLKRLSDAEASRDNIRGVIVGTGINHDGKTNGMTAPSVRSQMDLEREVYERYHIPPESISYVEMHGTGTKLGDPVELEALAAVYREKTARRNYCAIGSVKSNIGHTSAAAGVAGIHKVLLCMKHRQIVPTLNFSYPNEHFDFASSPFFVNTELRPWAAEPGRPSRAAVSSFGFSGTNAHLVLEAPPARKARAASTSMFPPTVILSARTKPQLIEYARRMSTCLESSREDLTDIAYTLQLGRDAMQHRLAVVGEDRRQLVETLRKFVAGEEHAECMFHGDAKKHREAYAAFDGDEELQDALLRWAQRGKYEKIVNFWASGASFDWNRLYSQAGFLPQRIALPTYPFERGRYWVNRRKLTCSPETVARVSQPTEAKTQHMGAETEPEDALTGAVTLTPLWEVVDVPPFEAPARENILVLGTDGERQEKWLRGRAQAHTLAIPPGCGIDDMADLLRGHELVDHICWVAPIRHRESVTTPSLVEGQRDGVLALFRLVKALLRLGYANRNLELSVVTHNAQAVVKFEPIIPTDSSIHGLVGSLAKEYCGWKIRLLDGDADDDGWLSALSHVRPDSNGNALVYRHGKWYRQVLARCQLSEMPLSAYRRQGVYAIVGGAGGIGEVLSEYLIRTYDARIVWLGRRAEDEAIAAKCASLARLGTAPWYIQVDARDPIAMAVARDEILARYGYLHGVVNAALVLADGALINMDEGQFLASLSAKVDVCVGMARAFSQTPLDFVLFLSSLQSFAKAPGQSNYAAGSTFKDAFAHQLANEWRCPVKVMNWGYWGSVGIVASSPRREQMARLGVGSIEPPEAMAALERLLSGTLDQVAFVKLLSSMGLQGLPVSTTEKVLCLPPTEGSVIDWIRQSIQLRRSPVDTELTVT